MPGKPTDQMLGLLSGYWFSQCLYVFAELAIADRLASGPKTSDMLAQETACNADSLFRFLRALSSSGIILEVAPRQFALTPVADTLRSDHPDSLRSVALLGGHPVHWSAWGNLLDSVRTGATALDAVQGKSFFDVLEENSALATTFQNVMGRLRDIDRSIAEAVDLRGMKRIVDIGGGTGELARQIAKTNPDASLILLDRRPVVAMAPKVDRIEVIDGDFLDRVPNGYQAYFLKFVLHDWDDSHAVRILKNCRDAMSEDGRVFVVEVIVPDDATPSVAKTHDVNMLVLTGGRERTFDEYRRLFTQAHLEFVRAIPATNGVTILEARPA